MSTCLLQEIAEDKATSGERSYSTKDYEKLHLAIGLDKASLEGLKTIEERVSGETAIDSQFRSKIANWALHTADKTAMLSAVALPQTTREALARKLFFGPIFTSGLMQHFIHMKSWTGRALALSMNRLPGGTAGAFAADIGLNAATRTHQIRDKITYKWQSGWENKMWDLIKSEGVLARGKYLAAIRDNTGTAQEIWKEIILNINQENIKRPVTWSSPELEALGTHVKDTYADMYAERTTAGGLVDTTRRAPIRFNKNLSATLDRMGYDGVIEAAKRAGNPEPQAVWNTLAYDINKKDMTILGNSIRGEIDLGFTSNGASLMDAVDLNGWAGVDRDIHRVSSHTAMKQATGGLIGSTEEWNAALKVVAEELLHNKVDPKTATKQIQLLQDTWDSLSGNPLRGGVAPEVQMLRSAAVHAYLGTAGYAQLGVVSLSLASKLAGMALQRGGTALGHLLKNTGKGTILAKELESLVANNRGVAMLLSPTVTEELAGNIKYGILRTITQTAIKGITFSAYQNTISRTLMTANFMNVVSKYASKFITTQTVNDVARYYRGVPTSMEHKRGVTAGFWDPTGPNPILKEIFGKMHYTEEGNLQSLNLEVLEASEKAYLSGLLTAELNRISGESRVAGEFPSWLNGLVAHSLLQFKDIGLKLASSNTMAGIRYGDKDAVFEHLTAAGLSSMLIYGRESAAEAISSQPNLGPADNYGEVVKHLTRMNELMGPISDVYNVYSLIEGAPRNQHMVDTLMGEAPITALAHDMFLAVGGKDANEKLTAAASTLPFKSVLMADKWANAYWKPAMVNDLVDFQHWDAQSTHHTAGRREWKNPTASLEPLKTNKPPQ